ncbi:hypothetical protein [Novosphingobium album (ex Liu et al. 2023)]|uniref:Uncharacterized protein n=1 Tax=Novosphingobium album (ex Liu et al. 2023) TaxID=3031130 RepID=A0ABT5WL27_9SPHN|nr:hypothetical protein [Novosphingobium album (ex Liu et al. 2023)]MDE8650738.1 hypothetical protein [Novosphingobium album (ex Liu et al. 2023)]
MSAFVFRSSRPHESILPRAHRDAHQRYLTYGPIVPMDSRPGLIERIFGRAA